MDDRVDENLLSLSLGQEVFIISTNLIMITKVMSNAHSLNNNPITVHGEHLSSQLYKLETGKKEMMMTEIADWIAKVNMF